MIYSLTQKNILYYKAYKFYFHINNFSNESYWIVCLFTEKFRLLQVGLIHIIASIIENVIMVVVKKDPWGNKI